MSNITAQKEEETDIEPVDPVCGMKVPADIEIFTEAPQARQIATTIAHKVHQGMSTDGVIAILPVEDFMHIREFEEVANDG